MSAFADPKVEAKQMTIDHSAVEFADVYGGNLVAFKVPAASSSGMCRDKSRWCGEHGYRAYDGERREVQLDYVFVPSAGAGWRARD